MNDHITEYSALTIPYALAVVPSNAFVKLSGFSTFSAPPSAAQPETTMMRMMTSFITPSAFCRRRPHFKARP